MNRQPRIIIAGQVPPPMGGQNLMIYELLQELRSLNEVNVEHLMFQFTRDTRSARKGQFLKFIELLKVIKRLFKIRLRGSIDLLVYPSGGPQSVPLIRDLLLLPWVLLLSRRVIIHFHAAGISDKISNGSKLAKIVGWLSGLASDSIVMTRYNQKDPQSCGLNNIHVIPHCIKDRYSIELINRGADEIKVLAMGHICKDKGVPALIRAIGKIANDYPNIMLCLAGECLAPYTEELLLSDLEQAGIKSRVRLVGVVTGDKKDEIFANADLFVFASVAPYESFGLVIVEAMMWGLPIVISDWRGNQDVVHGAEGAFTFSPPKSSDALEKCLRDLICRRDEWQSLGLQNRYTYLTKYSSLEGDSNLASLLIKLAGTKR